MKLDTLTVIALLNHYISLTDIDVTPSKIYLLMHALLKKINK